MGMPMAVTEAEEIAKALNALGIQKLTGKGVDPALSKALKQKNTTITNTTADATREIQSFFDNIEEVKKYLISVTQSAMGDKYGKLALIDDLYSYINTVLAIESDADKQIQTEIAGFDARRACAAEIAAKIEILSPKHAVGGVPLMHAMAQLDSAAKKRIFVSDRTKAFYDSYLQQAALFKNIETIQKLPEHLLTSVQVSEKILAALQAGMHINRAEAIWAFNHLLGLTGANQFVDMEDENAYLTCSSCGTVNRLDGGQLASLYSKKKCPLCNTCQESLLSSCPNCKKWMPKGAKRHLCGWDVEYTQRKISCEKAIQAKNISSAQRFLMEIETTNPGDKDLIQLRTKIDTLVTDLQTRLTSIRALLKAGQLEKAEKEVSEAIRVYPNDSDLLSLETAIADAEQAKRRVEMKAEIQDLIDKNRLAEALDKVKDAELAGLGTELDEFRIRIRQQVRITLINAYGVRIEKQLYADNIDAATEILNEAEIQGLGDELFTYRKKIDEKREEQKRIQAQALRDFGDGHFGSYTNGVKKIARILDFCPSCQQAKIWLKDNPRKEGVAKPTLTFKQGDSQCTISWEDDDSFVLYTVRRADNRYPRDPNDGVAVCANSPNKKVTDTLPTSQPGVMWQYSIFAIRNLDGQWVKTDCPGEAAWLPNPEEIRIDLEKDTRNRPIAHIYWTKSEIGCSGVKIVRYSDDDDFSIAETMIDVGDRWDKAQMQCEYIDTDVDHSTTYRYIFRQVWKKGMTKYMSLGTTYELEVK